MTSYEPVNGIGRRQSFVALALRRYRQDPTFRGLVEFAVIGGVFLALLQLFSSGDPTGLSHLTSPSTKTELHEPPQAPANPPAHVSTPAAPGRSAMPASLGDLLAHAADGLFPRLPRADDLQIDSAFLPVLRRRPRPCSSLRRSPTKPILGEPSIDLIPST